jgi:hypothetical protein
MSVSPEILCLQESNRIESIATTFCEYAILFAPKLQSAALTASCPPDGCAMLVNRNRFEVVHVKILYLTDPSSNNLSNQNAIFALLLDIRHAKKILAVRKT